MFVGDHAYDPLEKRNIANRAVKHYAEIPTGISAVDVEPVRYVASAKAECNPRRGSGLL